jgi:hypothetical protein
MAEIRVMLEEDTSVGFLGGIKVVRLEQSFLGITLGHA